jgi:hypothetical protein
MRLGRTFVIWILIENRLTTKHDGMRGDKDVFVPIRYSFPKRIHPRVRAGAVGTWRNRRVWDKT